MSQPRQDRTDLRPRRDPKPSSGRDLADSPARDRFMGEGLDAGETAPSSQPDETRRRAGGGFDSQRTYADADYGKGEEAHRDPQAGAARDPFGGRGERKPDGDERPDDKPNYPAEVARDRWTDASAGSPPKPPRGLTRAADVRLREDQSSDADELTLDTSHGGIGQHQTSWSQNVGPMGVSPLAPPVHGERYGQYGDGTDASGYAGFRESHLDPVRRSVPPLQPTRPQVAPGARAEEQTRRDKSRGKA